MNKNKTDNWLVFDAENKILGRLASQIAIELMGKNKVNYAPNKITGDQIIIINSQKIKVTGKKLTDKLYYRHSGYPGGLKTLTFKTILEKNPNFIIKNAVKGMLPKNKLQKILLKRLKIYSGSHHPHIAQQPKTTTI